jgi:hypothetical protein
MLYLDSATDSYNAYNNYTTRHLQHYELVYLPSRRCDPTSHLSSLMTAVRLSLRSWLTPLESDPDSLDWAASLDCILLLLSRLLHLITGPLPFISLWTDCSLLPSLSLMSCIVRSYRGRHVQRLRCGLNALIVVRTSVAMSRPSIS